MQKSRLPSPSKIQKEEIYAKNKIHADSESASRNAFQHYCFVDKLKTIAYASVIRYRRSCFSTYAQSRGTSQALLF
jgi:hypothetical protein